MIERLLIKYKNLSLPVKSALWFTIGNFLNLGISIITTPFFTRLLTENQMGQVSVYNTWQSLLSVIITLNLAYGVYEICLVKHEEDQDNLTSSLVMITFLFVIFYTIIVTVFNKEVSRIIGLENKYIYIMVYDILFGSIITFWITKNKFKFNYKPCILVLSGLALTRSILSLLLVITLKHNKLFYRIVGYALPNYIIGIILMFLILKRGKKPFKINYWVYAIKFNIVLIPHYLSGILLSSSDRIMIARIIGEDKAGVYSISYTCASLINILFNSINSVFTPYIYIRLKNKEYEQLREKANKLVLFTLFCAFILITVAPEAIRIFAPPSYYEGVYLIPPITMGIYMIFLYSIFSSIEFYFEKNKFITIATILGAVINIVLNIIFIPIFGYYAAAYTTLIGYIIMAIAHYFFYKKIIPQPIFDIKKITQYICIFMAASFAMLIFYKYLIIRIIIITTMILGAVINKSKLLNIFKI